VTRYAGEASTTSSVLSGWERYARLTPHALAFSDDEQELTYAVLARRVAVLSARLQRGLPSVAGDERMLVAVLLERGVDVLVGALAAHRVGAAFTIIEPGLSMENYERLLEVMAPSCVISSEGYRDVVLAGIPVVSPLSLSDSEEELYLVGSVAEASASSTAYVVYTSGTSGTPKGVEVSGASVDHYTAAIRSRLGIEEPMIYAHLTSLAADLGYTSLFLALATGGSVHVMSDAIRRDPAAVVARLEDLGVQVVKTTPSQWQQLSRAINNEHRGLLEILILGGEQLSAPFASEILASGVATRLINHYGPSETTVGVCTQAVTPATVASANSKGGSIPIGRPLSGNEVFVDDGTSTPVLWNAGRSLEGELIVSGPQVARGYYLDASRSTEDAFRPVYPGGPRAYRTGDLVRVAPVGDIEFLGRRDRQVKISGYRVELGDVEDRLRHVDGVANAHAFSIVDGRNRLCAVVTPEVVGLEARQVRAAMRAAHPDHVIPERVAVVAQFPLTQNGKVDVAQLRRLVTETVPRHDNALGSARDHVRSAWSAALGHDQFSDDDDFADVGGTSIASIHVVATLQQAGWPISAAEVFEITTVADQTALLHGVGSPSPVIARRMDITGPDHQKALTPAQSSFFARGLSAPDHWNQAVVLQVPDDLDLGALQAAVDDVVTANPQLCTAFSGAHPAIIRHVTDWRPVVSESRVASLADADGHLRDLGNEVQSRIRVEYGRLFVAHLVRGPGIGWLVLVAHHLAVDAVSWRLMLALLDRRYGRHLAERDPEPPVMAAGLGVWATALESARDELRPDLNYWGLLEQCAALDETSIEADAETRWFALSPAQTAALERSAASRGLRLQDVIIAATVRALCGAALATDRVNVDVESHGRGALDRVPDASMLVSWFTATFPISIAGGAQLTTVAQAVKWSLDAVPHGGVAYSMFAQPPIAEICVNHLGPVVVPATALGAAASSLTIGSLRGASNRRAHRWVLTSRISGGRLVLDLGSASTDSSREAVRSLPGRIVGDLLRFADIPRRDPRIVLERESSGGQLGRVPAELEAAPITIVRDASHVVLSGATGFIGAHVLTELLEHTDHMITCIVRRKGEVGVGQRLEETLIAYTGHVPRQMRERVRVVEGDTSQLRFGLAPHIWDDLTTTTSAIFHFAADTRLAGSSRDFEIQNSQSVAEVVDFARVGASKAVHYASTLAVVGEGSDDRQLTFTEDALDIGQRFLNHYERSKFDAELALARFAASGGHVYVYRSGNVSAHSVTGVFRIDAGDNRIIQLMRGCVALGRVPSLLRESIVLSPVDVVARGIVRISEAPAVSGGTFHIESPFEVGYLRLFDAMRKTGVSLIDDPSDSFADLFDKAAGTISSELALARLWALRPPRRVRTSSIRTLSLLASLGVTFPPPSDAWVEHIGRVLTRSEQTAVPFSLVEIL
jgi:amino acid adenylation domain-containing protein/thioester reductase-like protein